jgi:hypothetical protein
MWLNRRSFPLALHATSLFLIFLNSRAFYEIVLPVREAQRTQPPPSLLVRWLVVAPTSTLSLCQHPLRLLGGRSWH